jgi:glycosyltransferase involved in cell wall biosynthesis
VKFSVLLPTRNRLNLLSYAIETVRRQDYSNWEIVVSDNFSDQDIETYVRSLNDSRIKYFRTPRLVPVTDNWNNALERSEGDYVVMLGDDDGLMKGYFSRLNRVINDYRSPDLIYTGAFLYAYPGVMPNWPDGFLRSYGNKKIYRSARDPFWLGKNEAAALVKHSLNFRVRFDYNMQFCVVTRKLINEMTKYGPFYQSPYPDYYASNAMMLKADRILVVPEPLIAIGISPSSFGFYYFNDLESKGTEFLHNFLRPDIVRRVEKFVLPGTDMNTSWLLSMEALAQNFGQECALRVNHARYRILQICVVYAKVILEKDGASLLLKEVKMKMTIVERVLYGVPLSIVSILASLIPKRYRPLIARLLIYVTGSHQWNIGPKIEGQYSTILDVFEQASFSTG